jgi:hypothetical protein
MFQGAVRPVKPTEGGKGIMWISGTVAWDEIWAQSYFKSFKIAVLARYIKVIQKET